MDSIKGLDGISELLRRRIAGDVSVRSRTSKTLGRAFESACSEGSQKQSVEALRERVASSLDAISFDDPARHRKITRLFVENVLTWQFGGELITDPGFTALVDEVQVMLENEPSVVEQLIEATRKET